MRDTKNRELKRNEVFVPPLRDCPESWARNESYLSYLVFKRTGWMGKLALVLIPLLGSVAWLSKSEVLAGAVMVLAFVSFIALMVLAFMAEKKRRRSWH